ILIPCCILYSKSNTSVDNLLQFPSKRQRRTTYKILHAQMAETQPQPNLEIFSLTFDGYIDASKPRGKRTSTLKGTRNYSPSKLVIVTGNPGVSQGYPYPYPHLRVRVSTGWGRGFVQTWGYINLWTGL